MTCVVVLGCGGLFALVSTGPNGPEAGWTPGISSNALFIGFSSDSSDLVEADENGVRDAFLYDVSAGEIERVSLDSAGDEGEGPSGPELDDSFGGTDAPLSVSADGRFVAFKSEADNLIGVDDNMGADVFVRDRQAGTTTRVSVHTGGGEAHYGGIQPAMSADGRYVTFMSMMSQSQGLATPTDLAECLNGYGGLTYLCGQVFVHDTQLGTTTLVSVSPQGETPDGISQWAAISADGRYVAFSSVASNLVDATDTNGSWDVFLKDLLTDQVWLVSLDLNGDAAGSRARADVDISADGRFVSFSSVSSNLVLGDNNGVADIFVFDRDNPQDPIVRASVRTDGGEALLASSRADLSDDGRYVVFQSRSDNLVNLPDDNDEMDVFVRDLVRNMTARVSHKINTLGNGKSKNAALSGDGAIVVFESHATNWLLNDTVEPKVWRRKNPLYRP